MDPIVVQTVVAVPLILSLIVYMALQRERTSLHRALLALLGMILIWTLGMLCTANEAVPRAARIALLVPPACFMSPLFLLVMLRYARLQSPRRSRAGTAALMTPFAGFLVLFASNDWHGWMIDPAMSIHGDGPISEAGAAFWVFQAFSISAAAAGIGICWWLAWTTRAAATRRAMGLLTAGVCLPLFTHLSAMFGLLPIDFPLTPSALAVTCVLLVMAILRFRLLNPQPLARHDVVEASSDAVVVVDRDEVVIDGNPAAIELLGLESAELVGRGLAELARGLGSADAEAAVEGVLAALRRGEDPPRLEFRTADGRHLEIRGGRPRHPDAARAGSFVVLRDRSSERRAQELLVQSQKLESMGVLAAGVAHEVNNPLAFVRANFAHLGHVQELVEERLDELPKDLADGLRELPEVVADSVAGLERIHVVVQSLLRFSRMPGSARCEFDVNEAAVEAVRFATLGPNARIAIETDLASGLPPVHGSRDQLVQVLLNLVLNACKALRGSTAPRIRVETRPGARQGEVEICVSDNGPGVAAEIRDKIFDPFFTTGEPNEGTGLGLAIAFDIVGAHGGVLELDEGEGGASFRVRLPESPGPEPSAV